MKTTDYKLIEDYIFECMDFSEYQKQPTEKGEQISYLLYICKSEKRYNKYPTQKAMFIDWLYGSPSCFRVDYQQYKIIHLCENFGLRRTKNEYQLFEFWYGKIYDSVIYLNNKLNK